LKENNIRVITVNQISDNLEDSCDIIMEFTKGKEVYISIDIDVIDPAFAPATGYPEPGGLTSRQFLYMIQRLNKIKRIRGVDIVEINSEKDKRYDNITVKLGAKILSEFL
jgi:agmatinase